MNSPTVHCSENIFNDFFNISFLIANVSRNAALFKYVLLYCNSVNLALKSPPRSKLLQLPIFVVNSVIYLSKYDKGAEYNAPIFNGIVEVDIFIKTLLSHANNYIQLCSYLLY